MLRPMKGFGRLGVDTMAPPDDGGGGSGGSTSSASSIWPLLSTPAQPWAFGPSSSAAEVIAPPPDVKQYTYGPPAPDYLDQISKTVDLQKQYTYGPPAPDKSDSSLTDTLKKWLSPTSPAAPASVSRSPGGAAAVNPYFKQVSKQAQQSSGGGFLDVLKSIPAGIFGATPSLINAYTAIKYPGSPQAQSMQTQSGPPIPVKKTPWGTYMLIGAGVVGIGIIAISLSSTRKGKR